MKELIDLNETDMSSFDDLEKHIKKIPLTKDYKNALAFFTSYPEESLLSDEVRALLYQLIRSIMPECVLEIGCYLAGTSEVLARALWANNKGRLIALEPFLKEMGVEERISKWPEELRKRIILHNLNSASYFSDLEGIMNPEEHGYYSNLDLVFIDGNHEYGFALFDLIMAAKHCSPGGVIMLDNVDLPGVFWALKYFLSMNNGWTVLENCLEKHTTQDPFKTMYASFQNQIVLVSPKHITIDQVPKSFQSGKFFESGIRGYRFEFIPNNCEGILHAVVFFRSFYNHPNMGLPEEIKIIQKMELKPNQAEAIIQFNPLTTDRSPEKSCRRSEIVLLWQPSIKNIPLYLKLKPEPILVK